MAGSVYNMQSFFLLCVCLSHGFWTVLNVNFLSDDYDDEYDDDCDDDDDDDDYDYEYYDEDDDDNNNSGKGNNSKV